MLTMVDMSDGGDGNDADGNHDCYSDDDGREGDNGRWVVATSSVLAVWAFL